MVLNDPLATMLSKMLNALQAGKNTVTIKPINKEMVKILDILKEKGYVGSYERVEDGRGDHLIVQDFMSINKCGVIKPRFNFKATEAIAEENRYLPAKDFGFIIVSTSKGLMTLDEAKKNHIGGKLVMYCY